jgi:hemoglobin/transferrin/lactoferrin receptor protein
MPAPLLAAAMIAGAVTSFPALAQTTLSAVNVTAKGYETASDETPQAVETIAPDRNRPAAPAGELLRGEPGLSVRSDGAWGQDPVIRGLGRESIVVLVDGVRVSSAQPQGAIASMIDAGLLQRVEVVKGPASVLHGSGALGGAVNLLTPQPDFSEQARTGGRFSVGASGAGRSAGAALLVEHSGPEHAFVVGAAMRKAGDYDGPDGRVDRTGFRSDSLLARYRQRLRTDATFWFNLQRHADHDVWYPGSARAGASRAAPACRRRWAPSRCARRSSGASCTSSASTRRSGPAGSRHRCSARRCSGRSAPGRSGWAATTSVTTSPS